MRDFSIILLQYIHAHKKFKIFMVNLSQLESTMVSICVPMKQHLASPRGRGNHGNSATGQPPGPVTLIESVHGIDYTYHVYVLFPGELVGGTIVRAAVRGTQHGNHVTQMCPMAHWATTYIQQTVHVFW